MHGRNFLTWEEVFAYDLEYVNNITFINDLKIIIGTIKTVLFNADVEDRSKAYYKDGKLVIRDGEKERYIHEPLDVERRKSS